MPGRLYDATWGRAFAWGYDRFLSQTEKAGLREERRRLLSDARGRTVELGAGTGLNVEHYPDAVSELVLTEPDQYMAAKLRARLDGASRRAEVIVAPGERLPLEDASVDTVVATLVLCTVPDVPAVLGEIGRVLRPGGRFLFLEHVRSKEPGLARWQDRLHRPWFYFGNGCHCNRDTLESIAASPLEVERVERGELERAVPIVKPEICGVARRPAHA
jgi:ubiquinone/menaquinone biosynthesis C-methylase UbiE